MYTMPSFVQNDGPYMVRLYIHLITETDGSGKLTDEKLQASLLALYKDFSKHNIYFTVACVKEVNNSFYMNFPSELLNSSYVIDDGLNLFFRDGGGTSQAGGIGSNNAVINLGNLVNAEQTVSHEVGHCLGLYHTFQDSPYAGGGGTAELVNGNNCSTAGDLICETPADPGGNYGNDTPNNPYGVQDDCSWLPHPLKLDPNGDEYVNVKTENNMSYYSSCRSNFVPEQGQRMRNFLENNSSLAPTLVNDALIASGTIHEHWTTPKYFDVDVRIIAGSRLYIETDVYMAPGKKIIVEAGAVLNMRPGSKITVDETIGCNTGHFWRGIELLAANSVNDQRGIFSMHDATIEYAGNAVYYHGAYEGASHNNARIKIAHSVFNNNRNSLSLLSESAFQSLHIKQIHTTTFTLDENYPKKDDDPQKYVSFDGHVVLGHTRYVLFSGCIFENPLYSLTNMNNSTNFGAFVFRSENFMMESFCDFGYDCVTNPEHLQQAEVKGFDRGLYFNRSEGYSIFETDFRDNTISASSAQSNQFVVKHNNFNGSDNNINGVGVGFEINFPSEGVTLSHNTFDVSDDPYPSNGVGIRVYNTAAVNEIRNNTFIGQHYGADILGQNHVTGLPFMGLSYLCNTHDNTITNASNFSGPWDFYLYPGATISSMQGSPGSPAGNVFSHNTTPFDADFRNLGGAEILYFYNQNVPAEEPLYFSGIQKSQTEDITSSCLETEEVEDEDDITVLDDNYTILKSEFTGIQNYYEQLIDGGNTAILKQSIENTTSPIIGGTLKSDLLSLSPWLSAEVLMDVHEKNTTFSDSDRYDILIANPDALRGKKVRDLIQNSSTPITEPYRTALLNPTTAITTRTQMEGSMAKKQLSIQRNINRAFAILMQDTIDNSNDQRLWLERKESPNAAMQIADTYFSQGDFVNTKAQLQQIPMEFDLSIEKADEVADYEAYYDVLIGVLEDNRGFSALTTDELATLNLLALKGNNVGSNVAQGFLTVYYGYTFAPQQLSQLYTNEEEIVQQSTVKKKEINTSTKGVKVYPNPAHNEVIISSANTLGTIIELRHVSGKLILERQINTDIKSLNINTSNIGEGIYILNIINENGIIESKKLVISH